MHIFATGTCEWGDQCAFVHGSGDAAAAPATPKAKNKAKGKAKAKAKADVPAGAAVRKGKRCHRKEEEEVYEFDPAYGPNIGPDRWIADTGCGDDLIGHSDMNPQDWQDVEPAPESLCLKSANGPECASEMISYQCLTTGEVIDALVMKDSPPVLSTGRRCMELGSTGSHMNLQTSFCLKGRLLRVPLTEMFPTFRIALCSLVLLAFVQVPYALLRSRPRFAIHTRLDAYALALPLPSAVVTPTGTALTVIPSLLPQLRL